MRYLINIARNVRIFLVTVDVLFHLSCIRCSYVCTYVVPDPILRPIEKMTNVLPTRPETASEEIERVPAAAAAAPIAAQAMSADREPEVVVRPPVAA